MTTTKHRIVLEVSSEQLTLFKRLHEHHTRTEISSIGFNAFLKDTITKLALKVGPVAEPVQSAASWTPVMKEAWAGVEKAKAEILAAKTDEMRPAAALAEKERRALTETPRAGGFFSKFQNPVETEEKPVFKVKPLSAETLAKLNKEAEEEVPFDKSKCQHEPEDRYPDSKQPHKDYCGACGKGGLAREE